MANEVLVPFGAVMAKGVEVPISESSEKWSDFVLDDGTKIRAKVNIVSVHVLVDEKDQFGNPVYSINATPVFAVVQPHRKAE